MTACRACPRSLLFETNRSVLPPAGDDSRRHAGEEEEGQRVRIAESQCIRYVTLVICPSEALTLCPLPKERHRPSDSRSACGTMFRSETRARPTSFPSSLRLLP